MFTEFDRLAMTRALALAERGMETTHPNPRVGCVLAKGDRIIGEGWHERAGEPHAEIMALRSAKEPVAGATAYVTLEPCSHHGRTPPCANALIEARIARVVFAVQDPNPRVSGQGADALLRAGITVEAGLMQNEATELNIGFMKRMKEGLPWVRVKLAMSLDGRTALANGASQWITGEPARADVQRWRARCSAVMTGVGTVLADDPLLNVRLPGFKGRQPLRVVLDARLRSPPGAKMFASVGGVGTVGGAVGGAKAGSVGGQGGAAGSAASAGGVAVTADAVGAHAAARAQGASTGGGPVGGPVLIFAAADGGFLANTGGGRGAVIADPATLSDDMADLVNAFETSPTSVSARTDTVAGPVSVKVEPRATSVAPTATPSAAATAAASVPLGATTPAMATPVAATGTTPVTASGTAPVAASNTTRLAASGTASVAASGTTRLAASGTAPVAASGAAPMAASGTAPVAASATASAPASAGVSPPVLAAAGDAAGVAPTSDDATWAGAALSGAVPVKREVEASVGGGVSAAKSNSAVITGEPTTLGSAVASHPGGNGVTAPVGAAAVGSADGGSAGGGSAAGVAAPGVAAAGGTAPEVAAARGAATGAPAQTNAPLKPAAAVADSPATFQARKAVLAGKGARIEEVPADEGFLDLFAVLKKLGDMEVNEVLVEAGPTLAGQLLTTFFVDELLLYVAPKLLGPQGRPLVNLPELQSLQDALGFSLFDAKRFGDDLRLRMRPK